MYPTHRATFPTGRKVEVPCYWIETLKGDQVELSPEGLPLVVDFAKFDRWSIERVTALTPEGRELQGLIAVDGRFFARTLTQASRNGEVGSCSTVLRGLRYRMIPLELQFAPRKGQYAVVGLYR